MDCNTPLDHSCSAWQGNFSIIPIADPKPYNQFYIDFRVGFTYPPSDDDDDVDSGDDDYDSDDDDRYEYDTRSMQFWVPCDGLTCHNNNWSTVSDMLCNIGVPLHVQPFLIPGIIQSAQLMVKQNLGKNVPVLPMIVSIDVVGRAEDEEEEEGADTMVPMELRRVPASEASVEALETVKVEISCTRMMCVICLEQLLVGSEATRMPCFHDFHTDCIVRWLGVSNFCPLCRFQLPT